MGRYVVIGDLAALEGWQDLAEASSNDADVDGDALQAESPTDAAQAALDRLNQKIGAAEGVVDSYLLSVHPDYEDPDRGDADPLSPIGARTLDIALERVFGPGSEIDGFARRKRADEAIAWLRDLVAGNVTLVDVDGDGEPDATGGARFSAPDRVFTSDSLKGFTSSPSA
ncbi:MAG: hypothetical protein F4X59_17440 [Holophagales bacterium]|nr:hypothetical protein [Holophagales bacterium]MYC11890.1 hypothetical protein [Holophagales bacterium]MYI20940.1 hypothetical protein [Acidimicrobiia bacterium]